MACTLAQTSAIPIYPNVVSYTFMLLQKNHPETARDYPILLAFSIIRGANSMPSINEKTLCAILSLFQIHHQITALDRSHSGNITSSYYPYMYLLQSLAHSRLRYQAIQLQWAFRNGI